jgi:hypothetical protein
MNERAIQATLRRRARAKRTLQLWLALLVIWAVVVGWIAWGIVNSIDGDQVSVWAWLTYLGPTVVLGIGSVVAWSRWRQTDRDLRAEV